MWPPLSGHPFIPPRMIFNENISEIYDHLSNAASGRFYLSPTITKTLVKSPALYGQSEDET